MRKKLLALLLSLIVGLNLMAQTPDANGILFVNINKANGIGNSWDSPIKQLADALKAAKSNTAIKQIWVAKGTYKPMYSPQIGDNNFKDSTGLANGADHRNRAFLMVKDVKLYGGFDPDHGIKTLNDKRILPGMAGGNNGTILCGDFNNDDIVSGSGSTLKIQNNKENAYHVIVSGESYTSTELNGFSIKGGNANGISYIIIDNDIAVSDNSGGGIFNASCPLTIRLCNIYENIARNKGGGMYNGFGSPSKISISSFFNNCAANGGGIYISDTSKPVLLNVSITGNTALATDGTGGGIYYDTYSDGQIINSILYGNLTPNNPNNLDKKEINKMSSLKNTYKLKITNGIIKDFDASKFEGIESADVFTVDPKFINPSRGDLNLQRFSPAIEKGNNPAYNAQTGNKLSTDIDLAGNPRLLGSNIDIGAYESSVNTTVSSSAGASGSSVSTSPFPFTVTFSEAVNGFTISDIMVTNGKAIELSSANNTIFTFIVKPSGSGAVSVIVPANVALGEAGNGNTASATYTLTPPNAAPLVTTTGGSTTFSGSPVAIDNALTVTDADNTTLNNATVTISGNFHADQDILTFTNTSGMLFGNIYSSYSSGTGVLTLALRGGTATVEQWQAALRATTFHNLVPSPNTATRTVSFTVNDGNADSNTATKSVTVINEAAVSSIVRSSLSPTNASTVPFQVTFDKPVSGITASNFSLTTTGISGASVSSVSGSGNTYTVVVNTGTGDGTIRLDLANATGLSRSVSNAPYTSGQTYTITKSFAAAPTLCIQSAGSASGNGDVTAFVDQVEVLANGTSTLIPNALQNNSFEDNNVTSGNFLKTTQRVFGPPWTFTGEAGISRNNSALSSTAYDGDAVAFLASRGDNNAGIYQSLALPTGAYQIRFKAIQRNYTSLDQRLNVFVNDVFIGSIQPNNITTYDTFTSAPFNVTAPVLTATVSTTSASPTNNFPIPFTVTFSQSVGSTFTASDVTVSGGSVDPTSFSNSGSGTYTFSVTPNGTGTVSVSLAANVASDANNTGNSVSNSVSVQFVQPTTAAPVVNGFNNGGFINTTYPTFTGTATAGAIVTVYVDGMAKGTTTTDRDRNWSLTTPMALSQGAHTVYATAKVTGNMVSANSNTHTFTADTSSPTVQITSDRSTLKSGEVAKITFSLSDDPGAAFTQSDISVSGGTLSSISGSGLQWFATFTPTVNINEGQATIGIAAGAYYDIAGNASLAASSLTITYDTQVPDAPSVSLASSSDSGRSGTDRITNKEELTFTGTAEDGAVVTLLYMPLRDILGTAIAQNGKWSIFTSSKINNGELKVKAFTTDAAGNIGPDSDLFSVFIDTQAPDAPSISLASASDSGISSTDHITNVSRPVFSGMAEPGASVTLYDSVTEVIGLGVAGADGNWSVTSMRLTDGIHLVKARATDIAGNVSQLSAIVEITIDTQAPITEVSSISISADYGLSSTDMITNVASQNISGKLSGNLGEGESILLSFDSGTSWYTAVSVFGNTFSFQNAILLTGTHSLMARVVDAAGNTGVPLTAPYSIDTTPPVAPSISLEAASDSGVSSTDQITNVTSPTFSGMAESVATITLYDSGSDVIGSGIAGRDGKWLITSSKLKDGIHFIKARATDIAGNISQLSNELKMTIDTSSPTIQITSDKSTLKSGEVATITFEFSDDPDAAFTQSDISVSGGTLSAISGTGRQRFATFTPTGNINEGKAIIGVSAGAYHDVSGNSSLAASGLTITYDTQAPDAPSIALASASDSGVSSNDRITNLTNLTITGSAESGATVKLVDENGSLLGYGLSDNNVFSIAIPAMAAGTHTLTAKATDLAGNVSPESSKLSILIDVTPPVVTGVLKNKDYTAPVSLNITFDEGTAILNGKNFASGSTVQAADDYELVVTDDAGNSTTVKFSISKSTPVLTWAKPVDITYGMALTEAQLNASANVEGTFAYTPALNTILNAGANQSLKVDFVPKDAANYVATSETVHINVNQSTPVLSWAKPVDITYGTALTEAQLNASADVAGTFIYTPALNAILDAGANQTLRVEFTPIDLDNYKPINKIVSLNVLKKSINAKIDIENKIYDGSDSAIITKASLNDVLASDQPYITLNVGKAAFLDQNVGAAKIIKVTGLTITGMRAFNYMTTDTASARASINPKSITVMANAQRKTYGDADPELSYTFAPALVTGDSFTGGLTRLSGENVGTYAINQGTLTLSNNYDLSYTGADLTIGKKAVTVTAGAQRKTYGDADPALNYTFSPALVNGDRFSGNLTRASGEDAGTYTISQGSLGLNANYIVNYIAAKLDIAKAILKVRAKPEKMCQGDGLPVLGMSYNGFKSGDTENVLGSKPKVSTTADRNIAGTYPLTPAGGVSGNYDFVYEEGTLTIQALPTVNIVSDMGTELSKGGTTILTASGGTAYSWSTASGIIGGQNTATLTVRPAQTTTYTVRVTNASGCSSIQSIIIKVAEDYQLVATNILTPNGDGINDTWMVQNIDMYPQNEVIIIDGNGRKVYQKKGYDNTWNGTVNGSPLAEGTYYYIITYGPEKLVQKGFITILTK
ncbi:Ig-like domain-containing protein [uncultured Pedobacter sp.]|uniref:Ig-like domain-containing protein n=1 Tax=uncultured Pedobacter sp. TaxID=246139 RepID=UPI0025F97BDD|nr:Ig-like domain-containing protein [uncultured Pedobacter sp.]